MSQLLPQAARGAQALKSYAVLFLILLVIVRSAFLAWAIHGNTLAIWDEYEYFDRAVGFHNILTDLLQGSWPSSEDLARAYTILWPPMQAFIVSLSLLIFGSTLAVGRLLMVALSAATTLLVYLVTNKLSDKRAAFIASIIFVIYPSFVHYARQMLSETTYIFFFFLMFYFALRLVETPQPRKKVYLAIVTGCLLGFCTLTRAAGLLLSPAVALWTGWRSTSLKQRILLPAIILLSTGLTLLPWEIALFAVQGEFVAVAGSSDLNLYDGNNPWLPDGYGSGGDATQTRTHEAARKYSEQHGVSFDQACRILALQEITQHPIKFLERGFYKLRAVWSADFPLLRHILMVAYPPMSNELASLFWFAALIGLFTFLALAIWGLWSPAPALRYRELSIGLILTGMVPAFVATGLPRFGIPLLALLLPAAGHGLVHLKELKERSTRPWAIAALASIALVSVSIYTSLPSEYSKIEPSSHYGDLVRQLDRWLGRETTVSDRLLFRTTGDSFPEQVSISIIGDDFEFTDLEAQTYSWSTSAGTGVLDLVVSSRTANKPFQLQLSTGMPEQSAILPLSDKVWQTWGPSKLPGIEYMWAGSAQFPTSALGEATAY